MRAYVMALAVVLTIGGCKGGGEEQGGAAGKKAGTGAEASGPVVASPAAAPPVTAPPTETGTTAVRIIDRAIEASGGLEALAAKNAAFTAVSKGLYLGKPYEMTTAWKAPDRMHMALHGGGIEMGYVGSECWNVMNDVVMDCRPDEAKTVPAQLHVAWLEGLYPLKDPGVGLKDLGPGKVNGRATAAVLVTHPRGPWPVRMDFYQDTGLLACTEHQGSFGDATGAVRHEILTHRMVDGIQVPLKSTLSVGEERFMEDMLVSMAWEVKEDLFVRPAQRSLGRTSVRTLAAETVAWVVHEGPWEGLGKTLGGMMGWINSSGLKVMGAPRFVFSGDINDAVKRTEIQVPVTSTRDLTVQHELYGIKRVEELLVAFSLVKGPYDQVGAGIAPLSDWCSKNGYEVLTGPWMMTTFSDPALTLPEELMSELLVPVRKTR